MSDSRFAQDNDFQRRARRENELPDPPLQAVNAPGATPVPVAGGSHGSESSAEPGPEREGDPRILTVAKAAAAGSGRQVDGTDGFFEGGVAELVRTNWQGIQAEFVDDPRHAVEQADTLVEQVATKLAESIATRRREMRGQWNPEGSDGATSDSGSLTEEFRTRLREYRQLLNRLLDS